MARTKTAPAHDIPPHRMMSKNSDFSRFDSTDLREVRNAIVMELRSRKAAAIDTTPKLGSRVKVSSGRNEGDVGRVLLHLGVGASVVQFKDGPRRIGNSRLEAV